MNRHRRPRAKSPLIDLCVVSPEGGIPPFATRQTLDRFARSITRPPTYTYVLCTPVSYLQSCTHVAAPVRSLT